QPIAVGARQIIRDFAVPLRSMFAHTHHDVSIAGRHGPTAQEPRYQRIAQRSHRNGCAELFGKTEQASCGAAACPPEISKLSRWWVLHISSILSAQAAEQ